MKIERGCEIKHFSVRYTVLSLWNLSQTPAGIQGPESIRYFGSDFGSGSISSRRLYIFSKLCFSKFLLKSEYRG